MTAKNIIRWVGLALTVLAGLFEAFKLGRDEGYDTGYDDGWEDAVLED